MKALKVLCIIALSAGVLLFIKSFNEMLEDL